MSDFLESDLGVINGEESCLMDGGELRGVRGLVTIEGLWWCVCTFMIGDHVHVYASIYIRAYLYSTPFYSFVEILYHQSSPLSMTHELSSSLEENKT